MSGTVVARPLRPETARVSASTTRPFNLPWRFMSRSRPKRNVPLPAAGAPPGRRLLVFASLLFFLLLHSSIQSQEKTRLHAVELARKGKTAEALALLRDLHERYPADQKVLYDFLTVSGWAGQDIRVLSLFAKVEPEKAPAYVLAAAGKAMRNLGKWKDALALYQSARKRFPRDPALALGMVWTLYLGGGTGNAWEKLFHVLRICREIQGTAPHAREALRLRILAVNALGASHLALRMASNAEKGTLSPADLLRLRSDAAAQDVRWGPLEPSSRRTRFERIDRAVSRLRGIMKTPGGKTLRTVSDLIQALWIRGRPKESIDLYKELLREGKNPLAYVLPALADCFLQEMEPEEAARIFREILAARPKDVRARLGLAYALTDMGETEKAAALADSLAKELPPWKWKEGRKTPDPNPYRVQAETASILARLYGGKPREAQDRMEGLVRRAPGNTSLRAQLADTYMARGWVRRSREEIRFGLSMDPGQPDLLLSSAWNRLNSRQFRLAEKEVGTMMDLFSERNDVRRLEREWETHLLRELRAKAEAGRSTGDQVGSRDYLLDTRLFSSPFFHSYRGFLHQRLTGGKFPEGNYRLHRLGGGIEFKTLDFDLEGEASTGVEGETDPGLRFGGTWRLDDSWSVPASAALFSEETPLRALKNKVKADSAGLGLAWRAHESMDAALSLGAMDFDDGNTRLQVLGSFHRTLWMTAHASYDLEMEFFTSSNSRRDRPYFNPETDLSLSLSLSGSWLLYRKKRRSLRHGITIRAGDYLQKHYGGGFIGSIEYGQQIAFNDRFSLEWSAKGSWDRYDGERESSFQFVTGLNWRF